MRYVIIGNSIAAINAVEGIRSVDRDGGITIISAENRPAYSRPLISYMLMGRADESGSAYRPESFYADSGCHVQYGTFAEKIDVKKHLIALSSGSSLAYDRLLVAAGSSPRTLTIPGMDSVENRFFFTTIDDALALENAVTEESRVLIIGAGLIGLKCAESLAGRAASVTVAELADRVLPTVLDGDSSDMLKEHMERHGVSFMLGCGVTEIVNRTAMLSDGNHVHFDILVMAAGVTPNIGLIKRAGGAVEKGVLVDGRCRTSLDDVWSAGDCTQPINLVTGKPAVMALLPNASMQGRCAGIDMAGGQALCDRLIPMNATGFFGLHLISAGVCDGDTVVEKSPDSYKKLTVRDGCLSGYILMGNVERAGIYTSLIRERVPLQDIDFELIIKKPQLMAFSRRERAKKLGGAAE